MRVGISHAYGLNVNMSTLDKFRLGGVCLEMAAACHLGAPIAILILLFSSLTPAIGESWISTGAPSNSWAAITCSADGSKLVASTSVFTNGEIYLSHDGGTNWELASLAPATAWLAVASSAEGDYVIALASRSKVYFSTNSGVTWELKVVPAFAHSVAISGDGKTLAVSGYTGQIWVSTDYGTTWSPRSTQLFDVINAICSGDGTGFAAGNNNGMVTVSANGGTNWSRSTAIGAHSMSLKGSADLAHMVAIVSSWGSASLSFGVATSTNRGVTWVTNTLPSTNWSAVASSADGAKSVAVATGGSIYSSYDAGATWSPNDAPNLQWQAVASSADGNLLFAAASNGGIWVKRTLATPKLRIVPDPNLPILSWTVPSVSAVLQESNALDGIWTDVTNPPTLNLSDLSYQVSITPFGGNGFYRLKVH